MADDVCNPDMAKVSTSHVEKNEFEYSNKHAENDPPHQCVLKEVEQATRYDSALLRAL